MTKSFSTSVEKYSLSIIVPTYFRPDDLAKLLDSLLKQTILPKEIIIVDDTPDETIQFVCNRFKEFFNNNVNLMYIRNVGKRSSARSRNHGIQYATSDLVLFLDSDTVLERKYIKEVINNFSQFDNALGIQGWVVGPYSHLRKGVHRYFSHFFNKLFLLGYFSSNSCRLFEYPLILDRTINCEWLSGSNMTLKRSILNEYKFDDKLYKYSFSEDKLLSHRIYQKHPNSLYITPDAKILHFESGQGRMKQDAAFNKLVDSQRKYFLYKLFGVKGLIIYYWQKTGLFFFRVIVSRLDY